MKKNIIITMVVLMAVTLSAVYCEAETTNIPKSVLESKIGEDSNLLLVEIDSESGEIKLVTDEKMETPFSVNEASESVEEKNVFNIMKIRNTDSVYEIIDNEGLMYDKLLKVGKVGFQPVGEVEFSKDDVQNSNYKVRNSSNRVKNSNISEEAKKRVEEYILKQTAKENKDIMVKVYSPYILEESNELMKADTASTYYYYKGYGNYTYKMEEIYYGYTGMNAKTIDMGSTEILSYAKSTLKSEAVSNVSTKVVDLFKFSKYGNAVVGVVTTLISDFYDQFKSDVSADLTATVDFAEDSRVEKLCFIRQNVGYGMQDYLKAQASKTSGVWTIWYERNGKGGGKTEEIDLYQEFKDDEYNNLDYRAYINRTGWGVYDGFINQYWLTLKDSENFWERIRVDFIR